MPVTGKAAVSRADLLSLLILQDERVLEKMAFAFGYQKTEVKPLVIDKQSPSKKIDKTDSFTVVSKPIKKPVNQPKARFFYIAERQRKKSNHPPEKPIKPEWLDKGELFTEDACPATGSIVLPAYTPLIRWPRLWPFLKTVLGHQYITGHPDLPRLIEDVARAKTVRQLPLQTQHGWNSKICLFLDFQNQTQPYYQDFKQLVNRLKKLHGSLGFDLRVLHGEAGLQTQYRKANQNEVLDWQMPTRDSALLILTDLGLLAESSAQQQGWESFGRRLRAAGCKPQVLSPVPESLQNKTLQRLFTIHSWDRNNRLQGHRVVLPVTEASDKESIIQSSGVETLLVLLSVAVVIEAQLLRAVRALLSADQINVADEAGFWQHPDISSSTQGCSFKNLSAMTQYQQQLNNDAFWTRIKIQGQVEQQSFKQRLLKLIQRHHAYLPQSVRMMEMDLCERLLPGIVDKKTREEIKKWKAAMANTCYQKMDNDRLQTFNQQYISSLPLELLRTPVLAVLWAITQKHKLERGDIIHYPDTVNKKEVAFVLSGQQTESTVECILFQSGNELRLIEKNSHNDSLGSFFANFLLAGDLSIKTEFQQTKNIEGQWQWQQSIDTFSHDHSKLIVELTQTTQQLCLKNDRETLILKSISKPNWASQIGRDTEGLWLEFEQQGQFWRVYWPEWGSKLGYDQYGLYTDLNIKGVMQRCRYIPPGSFQMGSPKSEKERNDDEVQHKVILTQGYWLADTACTQALWQAVMGENPAEFIEHKNNPIEQVSWDDVQSFLDRLNDLIPGLNSTLPSEAQWENACRAGTTTPFSFGENITTEQVNYDGNHPYADGKESFYREKTVPVKSLPANSWGLYEMHGNVWEWCQDWYAEYSKTAVNNPTGSKTGTFRVLRGGSWINGGRRTRSADRDRSRPDDRDLITGFRFASGQVKSRQAEPQVAATERGKQPKKGGQGVFEKLWNKVKPNNEI